MYSVNNGRILGIFLMSNINTQASNLDQYKSPSTSYHYSSTSPLSNQSGYQFSSQGENYYNNSQDLGHKNPLLLEEVGRTNT